MTFGTILKIQLHLEEQESQIVLAVQSGIRFFVLHGTSYLFCLLAL